MKPNLKPLRLALMLLLPMWLAAGCASDSPLLLPPVVVPPAIIPPLSPSARQPSLPPICSPNCSAALTKERENWLRMLTPQELPAVPASSPTMR